MDFTRIFSASRFYCGKLVFGVWSKARLLLCPQVLVTPSTQCCLGLGKGGFLPSSMYLFLVLICTQVLWFLALFLQRYWRYCYVWIVVQVDTSTGDKHGRSCFTPLLIPGVPVSFCCFDKRHDQKQLREGKGLCQLPGNSVPLMTSGQGLKELEAETMEECYFLTHWLRVVLR